MSIFLKKHTIILYFAVFCFSFNEARHLPQAHSQTSTEQSIYRDLFETDEPPHNSSRAHKTKWPQYSRNLKRNVELFRKDLQKKRLNLNEQTGLKRDLNIGLNIKLPTTQMSRLDKLEEVLQEAIEGNIEQALNASCPSCDEPRSEKIRVKPAYPCDEWDSKYRICILQRNIGDTVTFYLTTGKNHQRRVTWRKEYHLKDTRTRAGFTIDPDNSPENVIIGKQGYELRVSPVTETDVGYNMFSAKFEESEQWDVLGHIVPQNKIYYMIRIVPIDLGFVYVGETIEINLRSFVSLPAYSLTFRWYMEKYGEHGTLPSNMRTSAEGSSIKISELRQEQEGILACAVYTNLKVLATKKRFLMKDLVINNDILKLKPEHNLQFAEESTGERLARNFAYKRKLSRRERDMNLDEIVEKALMEPTTEGGPGNPSVKVYVAATRPYDEYDVGVDMSNLEQTPYDAEGSYQEAVPMAEAGRNPQVNRHGQTMRNKQKANKGRKMQTNHNDQHIEKNGKGNVQDSEIILNIDKIPGPRRTSPEEKVAKMLSTCFNDLECANTATCVRSNLKQAGFCKCLPGYFGVGLFCREDIWLAKSDLYMEEMPDQDIPS